jgi:hypothetical protein
VTIDLAQAPEGVSSMSSTVEAGQLRRWCHIGFSFKLDGGVFLVIEVFGAEEADPTFLQLVKYVQDGKMCLDNIDWVEANSEVICEAG